MKGLIKKSVTIFLAVSLLCGVCSGCAGSSADGRKETTYSETDYNGPKLPDYSAENKSYLFAAYSGPHSGVYTIDGVEKPLGKDQRTVEGYTTYKDAGFNLLWMKYNGETWETSAVKAAWDNALNAGIDRVLVCDDRIDALVFFKDKIVDENDGRFKTEDELKDHVKELMQDYINYPKFYGVRLSDERDYTFIGAMGRIYKAIMRAAEELGKTDMYIHLNLLPCDEVYDRFGATGEYANMTDAYYGFLEKYVEQCNAKRISSDVYEFRKGGIASNFFCTAQAIKKTAIKYGIGATFCLQSFELKTGRSSGYRAVGKSEMRAEMYSLMGMGYDEFYYYTYQVSQNVSNQWTDETCFLSYAGEKTNVYYYGQNLMAKAQKMGKIILNYDYLGGKFYVADLPNNDVACYLTGPYSTAVNSALTFDNTHEFKYVEKVDFDNDAVFITELKDGKNDLYMYMIQNVLDPKDGETGRTAEKISVKFGGEFTHVAIITDGIVYYQKLRDGVLDTTLSAGDAVFAVLLK